MMKENVMEMKKTLAIKRNHLDKMAVYTRKLVMMFKLISIVVFFVFFTYLFEVLNSKPLAMMLVVILFSMILIIFAAMSKAKEKKSFSSLRLTNYLCMFTLLMMLLFLALNSFTQELVVSLIVLYLSLLLLSFALQKLIFILSFERIHK